jgi:hypothetical protein
MKKMLLILGLSLLMSGTAMAQGSQNLQKIYPVNSEIYEAITLLHISQGYSLPSTTGPWSGDELSKMLARVDRAKLSGSLLETYDFVQSALDEGKKTVKFGLKVAAEGYYHTDTTNFTDEADWIRGFDERSPFLDLVLETWPSEHFYGFSSLSIGNARFNSWSASKGVTSTLWGDSALTTNVPLVPPAGLFDLDFNIPYRAFGAVGGTGWSAQIGRDKLSWGPGETGNFVLGDHLLYHNLGRLTTYGKNFKYTLATSFFPHPANYYPIIDGSGNFINGGSQHVVDSGLNMFLGHRLEWKLFSNKVGLTLTEAIMYQSLDNTFDLRVLNPAAIFHNYYIRSNANSIISLELDYSPIKFVNIYGQMVVDEFPLPGEPIPGDPAYASALPNGFGFMLGTKATYPVGNGMFFGSAEAVKTDPYLYLRDAGQENRSDYTQNLGDYGINWVVAIREFTQAATSYNEEFIGYQYGGDAIVMNATLGYRKFGKWSVSGNFFHMIHGTHDKWTIWSWVDSNPADDTPNVTTPSTTHYNDNNGDLNEELRNAASYTTAVGVKGTYNVLKGLDVYGEVDYITITNPGNISTNPAVSDVQVTLGLSYTL